MRLMNIASGSSGNATYVGTDNTHILIDAGVSRKKITEGLNRLGLSINDLTAILITHEHSDHISGLGVLERAAQVPIITTKGTADGIVLNGCLRGNNEVLKVIERDSIFQIGDIRVESMGVSHDAREPVCYSFRHEGSSCAVVTDLGCYNDNLIQRLSGMDGLVLEANHDVRMLEVGPYPYHLKLRVGSDAGHLSNEASGRLLSELIHDHMKFIALGHISQKNNTEDLALLTVRTELDMSDNRYKASDFRIDAAGQTAGTEIYRF